MFRGQTLDLETLTRRAAVIHDQTDAMDALESLPVAEVPMLLVHDEYGHFEGLVHNDDLFTALAEELTSEQDIGSKPLLTQPDAHSRISHGSVAPPDRKTAVD